MHWDHKDTAKWLAWILNIFWIAIAVIAILQIVEEVR